MNKFRTKNPILPYFLYENAYKRLIYENPTETVFSNNTWHPVKSPRNNTIHTPDATDRPAIVSQPVPFSSSYPPFRELETINIIMYMENQLETIKANLPYGYEKQIAKEVGCSQGTVHNILNNKPASARSTYKAKVLNVAVRMANEALEATKGVSKAAAELETLHHGTAS